MTHEEALNLILAHACSSETLPNDVQVFPIETHCVSFTVKARLLSTVGSIQYEILNVVIDDE